MIIMAASIALLASAGTAGAASAPHKNVHHNSRGTLIQRNVGLGQQAAPLPNADLKYGPYPEYPQSPPGGGY
jgi:hypothetical protein